METGIDISGVAKSFAGFAIGQIVMSAIITLLAIGVFIFVFVKIFKQWNKNNHSPKLTVSAKIVAKRTDVSHRSRHHHHHGVGMHHGVGVHHGTSSMTTYYVTFQVESGDRMELIVASYEYGMLIEGDVGKLTFQGTRYLGFQRNCES